MSEARLLKALGGSKEMKGEGRLNRGMGGSGRGGVGGGREQQSSETVTSPTLHVASSAVFAFSGPMPLNAEVYLLLEYAALNLS